MWTTPRTWVTGELVTSTINNEQIRDNLRWASGPRQATFPASPQDGDEFTLDRGSGVLWRFKYRTGQTYPWECVGAVEPMRLPDVSVSTVLGGPQTVETPSAGTIPYSGDWRMQTIAYLMANVDEAMQSGQCLIGGTQFGETMFASRPGAGHPTTTYWDELASGRAVGEAIRGRLFGQNSNWISTGRWRFTLTPIRVAAP